MGNFFTSFAKGDFKQGNIAFWLGIVGQFYNRIFELDGSLDKKWLIYNPLFYFPPFSAVPAYYFHFRKIEKGTGKKPVDRWMYIIFFSSIVYSLIFRLFGCNITSPLVVISQILTFAIARLIAKLKLCDNNSNASINRPIQMSIIASILALSTDIGVLLISNLLMGSSAPSNPLFLIIYFINVVIFIPFGIIGYIPGVLPGLIMALVHVFLNMLNNIEEEKEKTCTEEVKLFTLRNLSYIIGVIIFTAVSQAVRYDFD